MPEVRAIGARHYSLRSKPGKMREQVLRLAPAQTGHSRRFRNKSTWTPGRNWINTGYGANVQSVDFGSPSGGRGKPVKMFVQPFSSPPVIGMRSGAYNGGYPMCIVYPQVPTINY